MVHPLMWAVRNSDLLRAYKRRKKKYESRDPPPEQPYPAFAPEAAIGPPPARTRGRVDFFVYFMVGPMSDGLYGYPTAVEFNLMQPTNTADRTETNRRKQRIAMKDKRSGF